MATWSPHYYRTEARALGLSEATISSALKSVRSLSAKNIPPLITLKHLSLQAEVDYRTLRALVDRSYSEPYRVFQVRKRAGGYRRICVPCPPLLAAQRWIHRYVLSQQPTHANSYAFSKDGKIYDCAERHCRARWLIKLDVQQFFESISERQVFAAYVALGFGRLLAFELTRLCTRQTPSRTRSKLRRWQPKHSYKFYQNGMNTIGALPQGAPTSPMLSNLVMSRLDEELDNYSDEHGLCVTRYADDIVFSTAESGFSRLDAVQVMIDATNLLRRHGLMVNAVKSAIIPPGARKVVLGLVVDGEKPRLSRDFRSYLATHLRGIEKFGAEDHCTARGFDSVYGMRRYLAGLVAYARQIESAFGDDCASRLNRVPW